MAAFESIDISGEAFALRLANLLVATRTHEGEGVGHVARRSGGRFSRRDLKEFEAGTRTVDETTLDELAQLYRCDLGLILPLRLPVVISANRVSAGGVHEEFSPSDPDALLTAYLTLVRSLRRQKRAPVVDLRREDIEVLSGFLQESDETVVHRLATLMNVTQTKRTAMIGVLASGALVIGLAGTVAAIGVGDAGSGRGLDPSGTSVTSVETTVPSSDTVVTATDPVVVTDVPTTVPVTDPPTTVPVTAPPSTVAATVPPTAPPTTHRPPVTTPAP
ncbi:MAG: hypothetical protein RJA49_2272, partial [Actinomycetota bacterium]